MKKLKDNEISLLMDFTGVPAGILLQVLFLSRLALLQSKQ